MESDQARKNGVCRRCGCKEAEAAADAKAIGLENEFQAGIYVCCQIVQWADEQWLAWSEAALADGKAAEEVTRPLEISEADALLVPVHVRKPRLKAGSPGDPKP